MSLNLKLPNYKETFVGEGYRQKATYLELPENYKDLLSHDVENGAEIFAPLLKVKGNNESNTTIVIAPTLEDGYRAVTYLASESLAKLKLENHSRDFSDEECKEYDFDEIEILDEEDFFTDEDDDDVYLGYMETEYKIPIIPIWDVASVGNRGSNGMGNIFLDQSSNYKSPKLWWENCTEFPVCVRLEKISADDFWRSEVIDSKEISKLKRFSGNMHLYILLIANSIPEEDVSITRCMLEYTANVYRIFPTEKELQEFYQKVLVDIAGSYGFTFSKNIDLPLFTQKITKVDSDRPCALYDKIMLYLMHNQITDVIEPEHLDYLGLSKLINTVDSSASISKIDDALYGLNDVKRSIENIIQMMKYTALRQKRGLLSAGYHNVHLFIGAPGTAKTTVAKMMASRMQDEGLLRGNRFISVSGAQLKASYLGQTAHKVHALFQDYDAILIDEAYSLTSDTTGQDSYAEEALAQLAIELEEHSCDKLIIFAGYGGKKVSKKNNRMYNFLEANPGIKSRINSTIYFNSYDSNEMVQLIHHMAKARSLTLSSACDDLINDYFARRCQAHDFGNGREARSFIENLEQQVASRIMNSNPNEISDKKLGKVSIKDIKLTIETIQEMNDQQLGQAGISLGF